MIFRWREGFPSRGASAARVRAELETVRAERRGHLRPADVVERARSRSSALHRLFEWDDTEAARKYRLQQARAVLSAVVVISEDTREPSHEYTSTRVGKRLAYVSTREAMANEEQRERILDDALEALRSWHLRYGTYRECAGLTNDIKVVLARHTNGKKSKAA